MLIVPEKKVVLILIPRTGSGALRRAVQRRWPASMLIYRHMEADGVPPGYDRWPRVAVVREPLERLWSLYRFLQGDVFANGPHTQHYKDRQRRSVDRPFDDWLVNNETVFTHPFDSDGSITYYPQFTVRHAMPENRKSQWLYARPDLGTQIWPYHNGEGIKALAEALDLDMTRENVAADGVPPPALSEEAKAHMRQTFAWDMTMFHRPGRYEPVNPPKEPAP